MIVYKIENEINGKIYIGITTKALSERIASHIHEKKSHVQKALNKYGLQSFTISVIDSAESKKILCKKEQYWIQHYNSKHPNGYNHTDGGDGLINPSKEVRDKISQTLQGHSATEGFTGHKHKEESKKQNGEKHKKIWSNLEYRKKQFKSRKGKTAWNKGLTKETSESVAKIGRKGKLAWNKDKKMKDINPDYVNSMQGSKRLELIERNKTGFNYKEI